MFPERVAQFGINLNSCDNNRFKYGSTNDCDDVLRFHDFIHGMFDAIINKLIYLWNFYQKGLNQKLIIQENLFFFKIGSIQK